MLLLHDCDNLLQDLPHIVLMIVTSGIGDSVALKPASGLGDSMILKPASLPNDFTTWSIPPLHCITQLLDQFSQAWFNGHASVIHPLSPTFHLPFWILSYWREILCTLKACLTWILAHGWVLQRLEDEDDNDCAFKSVVIDEVLSMFEHLPWDIEFKGFGAHTSLCTSELLPLLADLMVNGRLLDALVAAINDHVDEHNGTIVKTLNFANAIISMDASTQMILYGDSLGWSMPSSYVDAMHR
ncbi:hypothetical protein BDR06DRAFT_968112 [Suillus hirtellus]|nr:hypothetical protein BDR06DRAFT_968112 [Suillus hirtellus]